MNRHHILFSRGGGCKPQDPATRCDAAYLRWDVLKPLRCRIMACDALRCKFQHVQYFAPDFGISQLFIIRFRNGLQHCDGDLISFQVICDSKC